MGTVQRTSLIFVMMNLLLYFPLLAVPGDMVTGAEDKVQDTVGGFVNIEGDEVSFNGTGSQEAMPNSLQRDTVETGSGLTSYVSGLDSVWSYLTFLLGMVGNVYFLLAAFDFPALVAALIGVPIAMLQMLGIVSAIRGYDI